MFFRFARCFSLLFLLFTFSFLIAAYKEYEGSFWQWTKSMGEAEKLSFNLGKLTFESDTPFSREEFLYLTSLKIGSIVL